MAEFNGWLERRLAAERRELVAGLQEEVDRHLAEHHKSVLGELRAGLDISFAAADNGAVRDAALQPLLTASTCPVSFDSADMKCRLRGAAPQPPPPALDCSRPILPVAPVAEAPGERVESNSRWRQGAALDNGAGVKLSKDLPALKDRGERCSRRSGSECGSTRPGSADFGSASTTSTPPNSEPDPVSRGDVFGAAGSGGDGSGGDGSDRPGSKAERTKSTIKAVHRRKHEGMQDKLGCRRFSSLRGLVSSSQFELVCSVLIVVNALVMAAEVQVAGCDVGYTIGHPDCPPSTKDAWVNAARGFLVVSVVFSGLFFLELVLRVAALRKAALFSAWIWFDASLIVVGSLDVVQRLGGSLAVHVNPTVMRTARIARIVRVIRFLKPHEGFSSLFLIIRSIHASRHALCWSTLILMIMVSVVGMMVNQMVFLSLEDASMSEVDRRELFDYWGTYTRMVVTMFEVTLGNWAPPCRLLMARLTPWWGLFIVAYRCIFCYSIVSVIGAVFITETSRAAATDDEVAMIRKEREHKAHIKKLREVFNELDESGDGVVTWDEFQDALNDPHMRQYLSTMELEVNDMEGLFRLLDDGDGEVEAEEFVNGITTLRGQAKNIDLLTLLKVTRKMSLVLERLECGLLPRRISTSSRGSHMGSRRFSITSS